MISAIPESCRLTRSWKRSDPAGITDTLGAALLLSGLFLQAGFGQIALKLVLVGFFLLVTSPIATHALVKAAYARGQSLDLEVPSEAAEPGEEGAE